MPVLLALTAALLMGLFSTEICRPRFLVAPQNRPVHRHPASPARARSFRLHHRLRPSASPRRGRHAPLQSHPRMAGASGLVPGLSRRRLRRRGPLEGAAADRSSAVAPASSPGAAPVLSLGRGRVALPPRRSPSTSRDRPGILSYVFTAGFIAIFESRRRLWLLPVLSVIWANCHGGFFLGWIVCGAYCAEALAAPRTRYAPRRLLMSGFAVLLSGLNPNGMPR
jgi:hypothetical protein